MGLCSKENNLLMQWSSCLQGRNFDLVKVARALSSLLRGKPDDRILREAWFSLCDSYYFRIIFTVELPLN